MTKIEYSSIKLPPNTICGATVTALTSKDGTTLTRVIDGVSDDLVIVRRGRVMEIPWSQTKGGTRSGVSAPVVAKPVQAKVIVEAEEPEGEPVNDAVAVTRKRKS